VTLRNISMALLLCFSTLGCTSEGDDGGGDECDLLQIQCTGNTICEEGACEQAFPRSYEVGLSVVRNPEQCPGGSLDNPNCLHPRATVYFSKNADPILGEPDSPDVAEIDVNEENHLRVELGDHGCLIELTPERLRSGSAECIGYWATAQLSLAMMPR
jgi:hypothetical protein